MIGSGVFLLPAGLARFGWNAVASWGVSILGALAIALTLAALARRLSAAGGLAGYVAAGLGPTAGYLTGWAFWVSQWTSCAALGAAAASYLSPLVPWLGANPTLSALGFLALVTLVNLGGVALAGRVQVWTTAIKLVPLLIVGALIALIAAGGAAGGGPPVLAFPAEGLDLALIGQAVALNFYALLGFEVAAAASDRIDDASANLPRALVWGTLFVGVIYLIVCSGLVLLMPERVLANSPAPFADFVAQAWPGGPVALVALCAAVSAIGAMNGFTLASGEQPRAMALQAMLPPWFGRTNRRGAAAPGILTAGAGAALLILSERSGTLGGLFTLAVLLTTALSLYLYAAFALAALRLRLAWAAPVLALVFIAWALWGAGAQAALAGLALLALGLPLYWWARRRHARASAEAQHPA
jgi:APA family basic amino acid/polyamine antiporter